MAAAAAAAAAAKNRRLAGWMDGDDGSGNPAGLRMLQDSSGVHMRSSGTSIC